jgi:hypothetical protein
VSQFGATTLTGSRMANRPLVDEHGTPFRGLYAGRVHDRLMAEMLGIAKGMICDGLLTDGEAVAFAQWLGSHPDATESYPGLLLAERVQAMFRDGIVDEEERADLAELLRSFTGETEDQRGEMHRATRLPVDEPAPTVFFDGRTFCFTGVFAWGGRQKCEAEVSARGGRCVQAPTEKTDYVVIGINASPAWVQGDHGTKIEHALALKGQGKPVRIVTEEHWVAALQADAH